MVNRSFSIIFSSSRHLSSFSLAFNFPCLLHPVSYYHWAYLFLFHATCSWFWCYSGRNLCSVQKLVKVTRSPLPEASHTVEVVNLMIFSSLVCVMRSFLWSPAQQKQLITSALLLREFQSHNTSFFFGILCAIESTSPAVIFLRHSHNQEHHSQHHHHHSHA